MYGSVLHLVAVSCNTHCNTHTPEQTATHFFKSNSKSNQFRRIACSYARSVGQCVAAWCSALQRDAVCCSVMQCVAAWCSVMQRDAVCCSVMQCVAAWCSVLQRDFCRVMQCDAMWCSVMEYDSRWFSGLQCDTGCCTSKSGKSRITFITFILSILKPDAKSSRHSELGPPNSVVYYPPNSECNLIDWLQLALFPF